jgi:transposase-like protein
MGIFQKGMSKAAYQGELTCPVCSSKAIRFLENLGPYRLRYRCRKCGMPFQYETGTDQRIHPYAVLKKPKFQRVVEAHAELRKGAKLNQRSK